MDISHINLLRTAPSEHELGSGSRRRHEDGGLDVVPPRSNTVDRLSPASCRRQRRPQTVEVTPTTESPANPNPRRNVQAEAAMLPAGTADDRTDLVLIGASIVVLLLLTGPSTVVGPAETQPSILQGLSISRGSSAADRSHDGRGAGSGDVHRSFNSGQCYVDRFVSAGQC